MTVAKTTTRYLIRTVYLAYLLARDCRVPWVARGVVAGAVAYVTVPVDLLPDYVPVVGFLDDLGVVLLGLWLVRYLVPAHLIAEHRATIEALFPDGAFVSTHELARCASLLESIIPYPLAFAAKITEPDRASAPHEMRGALLFPKQQPRSPVGVEFMPLLARLLAQYGDRQRGVKRITLKLTRSAFRWVHSRLKVPARGRLTLAHPEGPRPFIGDFNNTALIQYARVSACTGYEPAVTALMDAVAPRLHVVYDVGANWGYYVALLATNPGFHGQIHAFEIAPASFRQLSEMVETCGLADRVACHAAGLSDRTGPARITREFHSALARVTSETSGAEARVVRLDELAIPDPDFVKIDVEGHEAAVLRGAAACLARAKPLLVFESWYFEDAPDRMIEPLRWMRDVGYDLYQLAWLDEIEGVTVLRRSFGRPGPATLALLPLPLEERPLIPTALELVAVHPDRRSLLTRP